MEKVKLIIKPHRYMGDSTIVSMRMPKGMLEKIDTVAKETGRTRNELLLTFIDFSLEHMEIEMN